MTAKGVIISEQQGEGWLWGMVVAEIIEPLWGGGATKCAAAEKISCSSGYFQKRELVVWGPGQ